MLRKQALTSIEDSIYTLHNTKYERWEINKSILINSKNIKKFKDVKKKKYKAVMYAH